MRRLSIGGSTTTTASPFLVGNRIAEKLMTLARIQSRFLVMLCFGTCICCTRVDPPKEVSVDELLASFVGTRLETEVGVQHVVNNAAASERAILFVHVSWAVMRPQQQQFAQFMIEYQHKHPDDPLMFYYVDCTPITSDYAPLRSLPGWQELEPTGQSLIQGWGELVWMEHGRVLYVERILNFKTASDLVRKTEQIMSLKTRG